MDRVRPDRPPRNLIRTLAAAVGRRSLLQGAIALGTRAFAVSVLPDGVGAKKKKRKRGNKILCLADGRRCNKKGTKCAAKHCLRTPFTIEARWSSTLDHGTWFYVPNRAGNDDPFPYIDYYCHSVETNDGALYPFAFVNQDAPGPGDEVTVVRKLLHGTYEYWIELSGPAPFGELAVTLRNANGQLVRSWLSPEAAAVDVCWHVFDILGASRSIATVNAMSQGSFPGCSHPVSTDVCPA